MRNLNSFEHLCMLQIKDRSDAIELVDSKAGYGIQLENVRFGYRPELPILQVRGPEFGCMRINIAVLHQSLSHHFGMLAWVLGRPH